MIPRINPSVKEWLEVASAAATAIGVLLALVVLLRDRRRDHRLREQDTYLRPNAQYLEYLKLCFEHPELDIFDWVTPSDPSPLNLKRERIAFTILVSMMEHAYLLYRRHPDKNNAQWQGWIKYMQWWMARPNFRRTWNDGMADMFDHQFVAFFNKLEPYVSTVDDFASNWMFERGPVKVVTAYRSIRSRFRWLALALVAAVAMCTVIVSVPSRNRRRRRSTAG